MDGHQSSYANNTPLPITSWHNPDQVLEANGLDWKFPALQDSWRSYRNDTTNLQQTAGFANSYMPNHMAPQQANDFSQCGFDPYVAMSQPTMPGSAVHQLQPRFTPYQPLRVSNGYHEQLQVRQARTISTKATGSSGRRYALRSKGPVDPRFALREARALGLVQHLSHSSSIPINSLFCSDSGTQKSFPPRRPSPSASPPPAPAPAQEYLTQASLPPVRSAEPQKLLIVVDLNGTLLKRRTSAGTNFALRPGVTDLMKYLLSNHVVMIYTSTRPENANGMVSKLFTPEERGRLAAVWGRDKLDLTRDQYFSKVQVYKKLDKIWADHMIQKRAPAGRRWDQSNTVLIDDSHLKALAQPYNLLRVEEFLNDYPRDKTAGGNPQSQAHSDAVSNWIAKQEEIMKDLEHKLEGLRWTEDVSRLIRKWQLANAEADNPINDQSVEAELAPTQLMTPRSPEPACSDSDQSDGGAEMRQNDLDMLADEVDMHSDDEGLYDDSCSISDGSVSPINEDVWNELLGDTGRHTDEPQTPKSLDG